VYVYEERGKQATAAQHLAGCCCSSSIGASQNHQGALIRNVVEARSGAYSRCRQVPLSDVPLWNGPSRPMPSLTCTARISHDWQCLQLSDVNTRREGPKPSIENTSMAILCIRSATSARGCRTSATMPSRLSEGLPPAPPCCLLHQRRALSQSGAAASACRGRVSRQGMADVYVVPL
jgi:hypothetical protein